MIIPKLLYGKIKNVPNHQSFTNLGTKKISAMPRLVRCECANLGFCQFHGSNQGDGRGNIYGDNFCGEGYKFRVCFSHLQLFSIGLVKVWFASKVAGGYNLHNLFCSNLVCIYHGKTWNCDSKSGTFWVVLLTSKDLNQKNSTTSPDNTAIFLNLSIGHTNLWFFFWKYRSMIQCGDVEFTRNGC